MIFPVGIGITIGFNLLKQTPSMIPTFFKRGATDAEIRYVLKIVADAYTYKLGVEDCKQYAARFWFEMNKMGIRCDYVSNAEMRHAYNRVKLKSGTYIFVEPQAYNYGIVESYLLENMWDKIPDINKEYFISGLNLSIDYLILGIKNGSEILPRPPKDLVYRK